MKPLDPPPLLGRARPLLAPGLALRSGDLIAGRYRITVLARIAHACAHLGAIDLTTGREVSVQVFLPPRSASPHDVDAARFRFLNAASRSISLADPRVARVLDVGIASPEGVAYVVRESLPTWTLAAWLEETGPLPQAVAVPIALDVCAVLAEAHTRGIIHGELSASCVHVEAVVGRRPTVKVSDIGTAHAIASLPGNLDAPPRVRAPEAEGSSPIDARADVWAVGALLTTMLTGGGEGGRSGPLEAGLASLLSACLAEEPSRRTHTILELLNALAPFARPKKVLLPTDEVPTQPHVAADVLPKRPRAADDGFPLRRPLAGAHLEEGDSRFDITRAAPLGRPASPHAFVAPLVGGARLAAPPGRAPWPPIPKAKASAPPVAFGVERREARTVMLRTKRRSGLTGALALGAAVAVALVMVFEAPRLAMTLRAVPAAPVAAAREIATTPTTPMTPLGRPTVEPAPVTPVEALPAAATASPGVAAASPSSSPSSRRAGRRHARDGRPAAAAEPAESESETKPDAKAKKADPAPEDGDDLRRYLDDRR